MPVIINEFEVTETAPEQVAPSQSATGSTAPADLVDVAQRLAQLEERELRVEAN